MCKFCWDLNVLQKKFFRRSGLLTERIYWNYWGHDFVDLSSIHILIRFINFTFSTKFSKLEEPALPPVMLLVSSSNVLSMRIKNGCKTYLRNLIALNIYFWEFLKKILTSKISLCSFCEQCRPFLKKFFAKFSDISRQCTFFRTFYRTQLSIIFKYIMY